MGPNCLSLGDLAQLGCDQLAFCAKHCKTCCLRFTLRNVIDFCCIFVPTYSATFPCEHVNEGKLTAVLFWNCVCPSSIKATLKIAKPSTAASVYT